MAYDVGSRPNRAMINSPRDSDGNTYLHELIRKDAAIDVIRDAIENGADVNALNKRSLPPLAVAIQYNKPEIAALLLDKGANQYFPVSKSADFNAVYMASDTGRGEVLKVLLAKGGGAYANSPGMTQDGRQASLLPLHIAVKTYHYDLIEPLIAAGALPNEEAGAEKKTPLMIAIENNTPGGVRQLLNGGADLERRHSETGRTPLNHAAQSRSGAAARALIDCGAELNAADATGMTPLMFAAENGDIGLAGTLISARADIDLRRAATNETALMKAARKGSSEIVKLLLGAGANPVLADSFNRTALRHAEEAYAQGTRFLLEDAEQKALQAQFEAIYRKYRP